MPCRLCLLTKAAMKPFLDGLLPFPRMPPSSPRLHNRSEFFVGSGNVNDANDVSTSYRTRLRCVLQSVRVLRGPGARVVVAGDFNKSYPDYSTLKICESPEY